MTNPQVIINACFKREKSMKMDEVHQHVIQILHCTLHLFKRGGAHMHARNEYFWCFWIKFSLGLGDSEYKFSCQLAFYDTPGDFFT